MSILPGLPYPLWAVAKLTAGMALSPIVLPTMVARARRATRLSQERIHNFPDHLYALAADEPSPLPAPRTNRTSAGHKYLITSDLHRCISGKLDWPARQGVKDLYADVLELYAAESWHLIENGDVEDFWMVGGSTAGVTYDASWLAAQALSPVMTGPKRSLIASQLKAIIANNQRIYDTINEGFASDGRYHRAIGNHDDVYDDPDVAEIFSSHLSGTEPAHTIVLTDPDTTPADGISHLDAVIAHGHLTDAWNGPPYGGLGRTVTWLGNGIDDLPRGPRLDGLPPMSAVDQLLAGNARHRLTTVDPRYGGNSDLETLDEERLFDRLNETEPAEGWPWLIHGHTHLPMVRPMNSRDESVKYANSGCGILPEAFTALEWDTSKPGDPLTVVLWHKTADGPHRTEFKSVDSRLIPIIE